jgi:hypothetical protein
MDLGVTPVRSVSTTTARVVSPAYTVEAFVWE